MTMMMLPTDGSGAEDQDSGVRHAAVRAWGRRREDPATARRHAEIAAAFRAILRGRVERLMREP